MIINMPSSAELPEISLLACLRRPTQAYTTHCPLQPAKRKIILSFWIAIRLTHHLRTLRASMIQLGDIVQVSKAAWDIYKMGWGETSSAGKSKETLHQIFSCLLLLLMDL